MLLEMLLKRLAFIIGHWNIKAEENFKKSSLTICDGLCVIFLLKLEILLHLIA